MPPERILLPLWGRGNHIQLWKPRLRCRFHAIPMGFFWLSVSFHGVIRSVDVSDQIVQDTGAKPLREPMVRVFLHPSYVIHKLCVVNYRKKSVRSDCRRSCQPQKVEYHCYHARCFSGHGPRVERPGRLLWTTLRHALWTLLGPKCLQQAPRLPASFALLILQGCG